MRDVRAVRVFIASPRGLDDEREAFRKVLTEFNEDEGLHRDITFWPIGWELAAAGTGRPQQIINDEVEQCDYLVLVLWDRWGSDPGGTSGATSGTEEEYEVARAALDSPSLPMRDIVVAFKAVDERQLSDPGSELQRVLAFRTQLEAAKSLLFATFDTTEEFSRIVRQHLQKWLRKLETGEPKGHQVAPPSPTPAEGGRLEARTSDEAERLAAEGRTAEAEALFAKIVTSSSESGNSLRDLRRYAQFLRRTGRLAHSHDVLQQILTRAEADSDVEVEIDALAQLGILARKQGALEASREYLDRAAKRIEEDAPKYAKAGYIYDNLGHTLRRLGEMDAALHAHRTAMKIRERIPDDPGLGHTYANIGSLLRRKGLETEALEALDRAAEEFRRQEDPAGVAMVEGHRSQVLLQMGRLEEARHHALASLEAHRTHGRVDGESMNLSQLARIELAAGDAQKARQYAARCFDLNQSSGNAEGIGTALHYLGAAEVALGQPVRGVSTLDLAIDNFSEAGNRLGESGALLDLSRAYVALGDFAKAEQSLSRSYVLALTMQEDPLLREIRGLAKQLGMDLEHSRG